MADYLVTGGAGFIGSNICEELVAKGQRVRVLDNLSTGRLENLRNLIEDIEFVHGDVCRTEDVEEAMDGVRYVLHQAAIPSVPRSMKEPLRVNEANVIGTLTVLECARKQGVRRVVFASSSSVYGDSATLPKHERMNPAPKSPYAVTKAVGEQYCAVYHAGFGLPVVTLRYFNVFGPRQDEASYYSGVICRFIGAILKGEQLTVYGDGEQSRDFTFVSNVVEANMIACKSDKALGQVINIGCGRQTTINELIRLLAEIAGADPSVRHADPQPGDVRHSRADIAKAQQLLGFEIQTDLREGLKKTVEWYSKTRGSSA